MTVSYLADVAVELLDAATDALVQATTGHAPPSEAWVSHAAPVSDYCCDGGQVTVHLASLDHEPFGTFNTEPPSQNCASTPTARYVITVRRCYPSLDTTGKAPTPSAMDDASAMLLADLWAILTELYDRRAAGTLFSAPTLCADVEIGVAEPEEPQGGCAGWTVPVAVVCNDSGPTGS